MDRVSTTGVLGLLIIGELLLIPLFAIGRRLPTLGAYCANSVGVLLMSLLQQQLPFDDWF